MDIIRGKRRRDEAASSVDEPFPAAAKFYGKNGFYRRMSQNTQIEAQDYTVHDSCVLRNFPKQKSSDLRFLAWVAYTRKFSDSSMTDIERRTCPLLWCRDVFPSEEAMLKHVYTCEYLSKGLYWCFHCQKPERVGKFQCKRCQGSPSTADRITTVAKKLFSGLGVKRATGDHCVPATYGKTNSRRESMNIVSPSKSEKESQFRESEINHEDCEHWELPNTGIAEMEAKNVFELSADWAAQSQELPDSSLAEMTGSEYAPALSSSLYPNEKSSHDSWDLAMSDARPASPYVTNPPRPSHPISLRLDTCITEPPRQRQSRTDTSDVLSPLSPSDRIRSGIFIVSPTDTVVSGRSMFGSSECSSATTISSWDESSNSLGWEKDDFNVKSIAANLGRFPSNASEKLLRDGPSSPHMPQVLPASLPDIVQRHPSNSSVSSTATHSANRCTISKSRQTISSEWCSPIDLVKSLSEVLEEHIEHSRQALRKLPPNSNTTELLALSTSSIRSIGFEVLERLLEGRNPSSLVHIFAFTNVAYSMAVTVDRGASKVQTEQWFQHCLSWSTLLSAERDKRRYEQIAYAIWQPQSTSNLQSNSVLLSSIERENKLVVACKHFLDLLQILGYNDKPDRITRELFDFARSSFVHKAKAQVIDQLIQRPSIEAFIEDVVNVENRLNNNLIVDTRHLELELICTAKLASQSDNAFARFTNHVTDLCNAMYAEESNKKTRTAYHIDTMAILYQLLPAIEYVDNVEERPHFDADAQINEHDLLPDFTTGDLNSAINDFSTDIDVILNESFDFSQFEFAPQNTSLERSFSFQQTHNTSDIPTIVPPVPAPSSESKSSSPSATKYRCHCGYVPTGEERWKASNLSRHKRIQHPEKGSKVYKCQWQGCGSTFTRSDNLKEHVRKKGHEVFSMDGERRGSDGESKRKRRKKEMGDVMDTALR